MTEIAATSIALHQTPGKRNMASAAFAELRAARLEGRAPEGAEMSFGDLIDTLNPLQHIPVVGEIYREITGDKIAPQARVAGGTLYGGPIGAVASVMSLAISGNGEKGAGDSLLAAVLGNENEAAPAMQTASAENPAATEEVPLTTASILPQRPAPAPAPASARNAAPAAEAATPLMPKLSPEAFDALLGSFADPAALRDATSGLMDADDDDAVLLSSPAVGHSPADAGLMTAMQQAMDKYEALDRAR